MLSQQPTRIKFTYDGAGNQTERIICSFCNARTVRDSTMTVNTVSESDLIKDELYNEISYYPNPVREELYIKWVNQEQKYVASIELFSFTGQSIQKYTYSKDNVIATVPFLNYPTGYYSLVLTYTDGERKTLKILRK